MVMIFFTQDLCMAQQRFQLQVCHTKQLSEQGPRPLRRRCGVRHLLVDTLMQHTTTGSFLEMVNWNLKGADATLGALAAQRSGLRVITDGSFQGSWVG
ncbi:hypothetical protein NKDENANG_01123 [Candidatus Entotheonellaceae bacterium PAL068K]